MSRDQTGSYTAEAACLTLAFVVVVLAMAAFGRMGLVRGELDAAARDAARAASVRADATAARADAEAAAAAALAARGLPCTEPTLELDTADFRPGGTVVATLTCRLALADLALLRLPGDMTMTARFVAPIDPLMAGGTR